MGHEFELSQDIELPATPEQVWQAIATGPGMDSWFMGTNEIDPRPGGTSRMTVGGQADEATVTAADPGKLLAYRSEPGEDGAFMAFEYLLEARDGGGTTLRLVQSGVLAGDWETEYEAMTIGWPLYTHTLAEYLEHFAPRTATPVSAFRPGFGAPDDLWSALGVSADTRPGDRFTLPELAVEGIVDTVDTRAYLGVRTDDALLRFIHSGVDRGSVVVLGHHLFDAAEGAEAAWQTWLSGLPQPA